MQKNNQGLSYTTSLNKWCLQASHAPKKTLTLWAFNTDFHDHVFTRPDTKILWLAKAKGQISLWKCDTETTNIYSAQMETFN